MDCQIKTDAVYDPAWDNFLQNHPMGHYTQSSLWGMLKVKFGWQVFRILVKDGEEILGGAQLLTRRMPFYGKIGYITKGPLFNREDECAIQFLFEQLEHLAKRNSILLVSIQPPYSDQLYDQALHKYQYEPSCYYIIPPSTVLVDLTLSPEDIFSQMKRTTRQNIRAAQSRGVVISEGNDADIPAFCDLKRKTESRSDFVHYDQCYYEEAWRLLAVHNHVKLWLATYNDELVAGLMAVYFGQQVVYAWAGSSRNHADKRPNDLLFWQAMMWGKEHGYRFCDLGGISPVVADAINHNQEPPDCKERGIARYKLGFGPMHNFPPAYDNIYILRPKWMVRKAISFAWGNHRKTVSKLVRGVID
jgi:peptidoglycan pentaglycine glycine transferase (the first glycine)